MANHKPLKLGQNEVQRFQSGDSVGIEHGGTGSNTAAGPMPAAASPDFLTINVTEAEASNYVVGLEYEVTIRLVEQA